MHMLYYTILSFLQIEAPNRCVTNLFSQPSHQPSYLIIYGNVK
jgi:hypothetical protein